MNLNSTVRFRRGKTDRPAQTASTQGDSIHSTGWFSPLSQHYVPLGSLADVYKGCKIVKERFNKFRLDIDLPQRYKQCGFLKGESEVIGFVADYKSMKSGRRKQYKSASNEYRTEKTMNLNDAKAEAKRQTSFTRETVDNGIGILQKELCDSFIRLDRIRKGSLLKEVVGSHPGGFYIAGKEEHERSLRLSQWYLPKSLHSRNPRRSTSKDRLCKLSKRNFCSGLALAASHRRPLRKNELAKLSYPHCPNEEPSNLSLRSSKVIEPYLKLVSLKEVMDKYRNKSDKEVLVGVKKNFNPLELVQAVSELLDKLHKNAIRKNRYAYHSGMGGAKKNAAYKKRIMSNYRKNVKVITGEKKKESEKPISSLLDQIGTDTCNIIESIKEFNKKKKQLKETLINSLDTQTNNRSNTLAYKRRNLYVSSETHPFKSVLEKILVSAERDKVKDYIEGLKVHAKNYYRLMEGLLRLKGELHSDVYYLMDYYKSLIESGDPIGSEQIHFLMENLYPSTIPQQITEYRSHSA